MGGVGGVGVGGGHQFSLLGFCKVLTFIIEN